ncbi:hypothetical protein MG293_001490 [Ovis ammon polii]|uniref:Uncharacterized protein n=1 Tax=Ovis ammon polii TaxID=230172 RepID=A0AAD4YFN9_OVIAM|nr:hypothetical protein MG293_001490 [Ovis ammon polii]
MIKKECICDVLERQNRRDTSYVEDKGRINSDKWRSQKQMLCSSDRALRCGKRGKEIISKMPLVMMESAFQAHHLPLLLYVLTLPPLYRLKDNSPRSKSNFSLTLTSLLPNLSKIQVQRRAVSLESWFLSGDVLEVVQLSQIPSLPYHTSCFTWEAHLSGHQWAPLPSGF